MITVFNMNNINVAVLGCGAMGRTIIDNIKDMPQLDSLIGYDISAESIKITRERFGIPTTDNLDSIMDDPKIKLVYIASPNSSHVPLTIRALKAGKAVMSEKPSGSTFEEINELSEVIRETYGFMQVGLECRYSKVYALAKKHIDCGEIGRPVNFHFTYSMPPFTPDSWRVSKGISGNMCLEKLCHYIDLVRWWNGSRVNEYVVTSAPNVIPYFEVADNMHVSYRFENEAASQMFFTMTAAHGQNNDLIMCSEDLFDQDKMGHKLNYIITGTEGAIEIDIFQRELRLYCHGGKPGFTGEEKIVSRYNWKSAEDHAHFHNTTDQNRDILKRVVEGEGPSIFYEDAAETMRLCIEFEHAAENKSWEIIKR